MPCRARFTNWVVGLGCSGCGWQHGGMLISFASRLTRKILSAVATFARRDVSSAAELLVPRHENTVLWSRDVASHQLESEPIVMPRAVDLAPPCRGPGTVR